MKKSLVLAMAMALGVTASAYAANPFSDVPAGHWAYDSVNKLAAAGVVDGYGDGSFGGDKLMTRYEMAQIVARAMANGANVDKLAAEFADELDALGVRVAALEKKADNVKIAGTIKYQTKAFHASAASPSNHFYRLRSDITIKGTVNDDWTYTALLRNEQRLDNEKENAGEEDTNFQRAYVEGKLGGLALTAGRYNDNLEDGNIYDQRVDGVKVAYGKDVKLTAAYEQHKDSTAGEHGKLTYGRLDAKLGVVGAHVGYYRFEDLDVLNDDNNIFSAGVDFNVAKDLKLAAVYLKSDADKIGATKVDDDGYVISLDYKGANASKPGSYGIFAKYYDQGATTVVEHTMDGALPDFGFKGYKVGANYAFAKNIVGEVSWYGLEGQKGTEKDKNYDTLFAQVVFSF